MKAVKRIFAIALAILILASSPAYAYTFSDVKSKEQSWAFKYIEDMAKLGYLSGMGDGTFRPAKNLTFMETLSALGRFTLPTDKEKQEALNKHDKFLKSIGIKHTWEKNAVSLAIENKIITVAEAKEMANKKVYHKSITKAGAGVFLAKAMGLEDKAQSLEVVALDYKDISQIDTSIRKYVKVLQDAGVFDKKGDGNGYFHPRSALRRDIFATMLSTGHYALKRPAPNAQNTEENGVTISRLEGDNLIILTKHDSEETYKITDNTKIIVNGKNTKKDALKIGMEVKLEYNLANRELVSVTTLSQKSKITGTLKGINSKAKEIILEYMEENTLKEQTLKLADNAKLLKSGKNVDILQLVPGDYAELTMLEGKVTEINTQPGFSEGSATVKSVAQNGEVFTIVIEDENKRTLELKTTKDTKITKGGQEIQANSIRAKDLVQYKAIYDVKVKGFSAIEINARLVEGTFNVEVIETKTIAGRMPTITVNNRDSKSKETYPMADDIYIEIDGEKANHLPFDSGYTAKIEVDRKGQITEIYIDALSRERSAAGRIKEINLEKNYFKMEIKELSGNEETIEVYVTNTTKLIDRELKNLRFIDLRIGDYVSVIGAYSGAKFEAINISLRE